MANGRVWATVALGFTAACGATEVRSGNSPPDGAPTPLGAPDGATSPSGDAASAFDANEANDASEANDALDSGLASDAITTLGAGADGSAFDAGDGSTLGPGVSGLTPAAVVLFAGFNASDTGELDSQTWEWDGTSWTNRTPGFAPSPRIAAAMAPLGDKVILFGGSNGLGVLGDTWEWDGTTWTQLSIAGPAARNGHLMAAFNGTVMLVGGSTTPITNAYAPPPAWNLSDTWVFDGVQWTEQREVLSTPTAWGMASAAAAPPGCTANCAGDALVLFGTGTSGNGTMTWTASGWSSVDVAESNTNSYPPPGTGLVSEFGDSVLLFQRGAFTSPTYTMWQWMGGEWNQLNVAGTPPQLPEAPPFGQMASLGDTAVFYQSQTTWIWQSGVWTEIASPTNPAVRIGYAVSTRFTQ